MTGKKCFNKVDNFLNSSTMHVSKLANQLSLCVLQSRLGVRSFVVAFRGCRLRRMKWTWLIARVGTIRQCTKFWKYN